MGTARVCMAAVAVLVGTMLAGCGCNLPRAMKVGLDPSVRDASGGWPALQVDMVPLRASDRAAWESLSINNYFKPGTPENENRKNQAGLGKIKQLNFSGGDAQVIPANDPVFKDMKADGKNAAGWSLLVITNLPGARQDKPGTADPRRQIYPLDCKAIKSVTQFDVKVHSQGVRIDPTGK